MDKNLWCICWQLPSFYQKSKYCTVLVFLLRVIVDFGNMIQTIEFYGTATQISSIVDMS